MNPLTILSVAFPFAPVGPDAIGGAEKVLWQLDRELTHVGHHSLVIAREDSDVHGTLLAVPHQRGEISPELRREAHRRHRVAIERALRRWPVDLVHMHGLDFDQYLPPYATPTLVTLHLPPSWYDLDVFALARPKTWLQCVSQSQRSACPASPLLLEPILNGVDLPDPAPRLPRSEFVLALGRICPEKGFHLALEAARDAGLPLILAGEIYPYPEHQAYFREKIVPFLDASRRYVGPVAGPRKQQLLAAARCVVIPSLVAETSSLVAMEALAAGTPVVALASGALPEIIHHGKTGFIVNAPVELAAGLRQAIHLSTGACRAAARTRFAWPHTARRYLALYGEVTATRGETHRHVA